MGLFEKFFLSMGSAIVLFLIFAVSSGVATFIESAYNTETAWALIYGANWFALVQFLLGVNLLYNIIRFKLFQIQKLPALIFHLSFLFILVGSGVTRYFGFEGNLHIRENAQNNEIITMRSFLQLYAKDGNKTYSKTLPKYISNAGFNKFNLELDMEGKKANLEFAKFVSNGVEKWVESSDGRPVLEIMFSDSSNSRLVELEQGVSLEVADISFTFNAMPKQAKFVMITLEDGEFYITTNQNVNYMKMADMSKEDLPKSQKVKFEPLRLYSLDNQLNFAPKTMLKSARLSVESGDSNVRGTDAIVANLSFNGKTKEIVMFHSSKNQPINIDGVNFSFAWSPMALSLPFDVYLKDFKLDRYPGSRSPMSYSSDVVVKDAKNGVNFDYEIYMNHVLDYGGYRFFQSSYDEDEMGTILSVNKDPGKIPTYIGYFLMILGLILNILNPNSRFRKLANLIDKDSAKFAAILLALTLAFSSNLQAASNIDQDHAQKLSTLIVQSADGRMKPFDTVADEVLNKVYRSSKYKDMNANQVLLSIMVNSDFWSNEPIIKISGDELKSLLGLPKSAKFASFNDFFKKSGDKIMYKLIKESEIANRKSPSTRNQLDKDVMKADEKVSVLYMVFTRDILKIIPKGDENHTWLSPMGVFMELEGEQQEQILTMLGNYFTEVSIAQKDQNWQKADENLQKLKDYQMKFSKEIIPSENRINLEIAFNKYKIFQNLTPFYLIAGFVLLIFVFVKIVKPNFKINRIFKAIYYINILAFLAHTFGLGIRWYIAEHAPWSDSYESMVYIAWALSFSGIVFSNRSVVALALTSILAGVTLFVAHLSWLDPQITTLVPVLRSYWLTIHVSVITASYGFLGLCSLLGFFTLILFILQSKKENLEISRNITEITRINEMAMILGLSLLTIGNFLGGVWANESWGRYWGWDSKETWALVSILVYCAIVHMRFVKFCNSQYAFALASMFAYSSIVMTYFGVNFYLTGMHSYAAGDAVPIPKFVWVTILIMVIVSVMAFFKRKFAKSL